MTYFFFILAIFIWPFGQLLNVSLWNNYFTLYPLDIVCTLLALTLLLSSTKRRQVLSDPLTKPLACFLLAATVSLVLNLPQAVTGGLGYSFAYLFRLFVYPALYYAAKVLSKTKVLRPVWISLTIFLSLGLAQYLFLPDTRFLKNIGFDDHYYRLVGSFYDPNFSGAILAGLSLSLLALGQWLLALPTLLLLVLTFSRASYLVFIVGVIYLLSVQKKWRILFFLFLLAGAIALAPKPFGEGVNLLRTFSLFSRLESWQTGFTLFLEKPLFGWGYNTLRSLTGQRFQIDNSYLYLAATTGLLGLTAFLNLLKQILKNTTYLPQRIFVLSLLGHSLFNNSLFYIWIFFAFWLMLGLAAKGYKES